MDYTFAANLAPCVLDILRKKSPCSWRTPGELIIDNENHENTDGSLTNVTFPIVIHKNIFITSFFFFYSGVR